MASPETLNNLDLSSTYKVETMDDILFLTELTIGIGNIGPQKRIDLGEINDTQLNEYYQSLIYDPSLYKEIDSGLVIPLHCADGRTLRCEGFSAIGGTFSLVAADSLGPRRFYSYERDVKDHAEDVFKYLTSQGYRVGGHDASHHSDSGCGCGGEDVFDSTNDSDPSILGFIHNNGYSIRSLLENLTDTLTGKNIGLNVDNSLHDTVFKNTSDLKQRTKSSSPYFIGGKYVREAMVDVAGEQSVERLEGDHKEVSLVLDLRQDFKVLDRNALNNKHGSSLQTFYVNVFGLRLACDAMYMNDSKQADLAFMSALYYNVAAAAVLSDKSLRLIVLA